MGSVWKAVGDDGDVVALKFVHETRASSAKLRRRLIREAKAACRVSHPCVVQVHDIMELEDGSPVMVMEFLEGESLAERLDREGEIPIGELAPLMQQVVSAVGAAHALGVVHRDLKPENIFLATSPDGTVTPKVLDFGIAKLEALDVGQESTELTKTGAMLGTPCYMAPEQVYGEKDIDARADIWALGLVMYRALSGLLPTKADNVGQVMKIITVRGIWPLSQASADLPEDITGLVDRMLMRERTDRVASLHEVRDVLARYTELDAPDFGPPASSAMEVAPESVVEPIALEGASGPRTKRSPRPLVWLALLALPLVALAGWWGLGSTAPAAPEPNPVAAVASPEPPPAPQKAQDPAPTPQAVTDDPPKKPDESPSEAPSAAPAPARPATPPKPAKRPAPRVEALRSEPKPAAPPFEPEPAPAARSPGEPGAHGRVVEQPPF